MGEPWVQRRAGAALGDKVVSEVPLPWSESAREAGQYQEDCTNSRCVAAAAGGLKPPCGPGGNIMGLQKDKLGLCGSWGGRTYKARLVLVCQAG